MNLDELLQRLKSLTDEERRALLSEFCRSCSVYIEETDWAGLNYCYSCSPDPNSRDF